MAQGDSGSRRWDQLASALPLLAIFFWVGLFFLWQARHHVTPWLFPDELKYAELARSVAAGWDMTLRGTSQGFPNGYAIFTAPAWVARDVPFGYEAAKASGVFAMVSVIFPTYGLARMVAARPAALFAAGASVLVPALVYSSMLLTETLAYFWAALCFLSICKALVHRNRAWILAAVLVSAVAPIVRQELGVIPVILVGLVFWHACGQTREPYRRILSVVFPLIAGIALWLVLIATSQTWRVASQYPLKSLEYGIWAIGALCVGLGILPMVAGFATALTRKSAVVDREDAVFRRLIGTSTIAFFLYAASKAGYLSTLGPPRVEERNVIYLVPLLAIATARWVSGRRIERRATFAAAAVAAALIALTPYRMELDFYSDAPGLAILQMLRRELGLTAAWAEVLLLGVLIVVLAGFQARQGGGSHARLKRVVVVVACGSVLAWGATGAFVATTESNKLSRAVVQVVPLDRGWIDHADGGSKAIVLADRIGDSTLLWETEFWNRSLSDVWTFDQPGPGPGQTKTASIISATGELVPAAPARLEYVLTDEAIVPKGQLITTRNGWSVYRIERPLRLARQLRGIFPDGWMGDVSEYNCFRDASCGTTTLTLSRGGYAKAPRGHVTVTVGRLLYQTSKARLLPTKVLRFTLPRQTAKTITLQLPAAPAQVSVTIDHTFSPSALGASDTRQLGARISYTNRSSS